MTVTVLPDNSADYPSTVVTPGGSVWTGDTSSDDQTTANDYGNDEFDIGSKFQDTMQYPIYYDNAVDNDETNGRVVLSDCRQINVVTAMNQIPTVQVTYPRDGLGSKIMQPEGIIMTDCSRQWTHQKFRIKQMTKDGDQLIINANHIIGDFADLTLYKDIQIPDATCEQVFDALMLNSTSWIPDARYTTDINDVRNVDINSDSGRLSNYIFDADAEGDKATQSLIGLFGGEMMADNYHLYHEHKLGRDTGIVITYGGRIQSFQQDQNIENTYTCIYPKAKYTPGQAIATEKNTDWSQWFGNWDSVGTVQYNAGGSISVYDSPVEGASIIGTISTGSHLKVGKPVADGDFTPDGKFQINTVNGDTWYPVETSVGDGWIDAAWITFSKNGDYLVNDAIGHIHTAVTDTDSKNTHYPISGTGTVNYLGKQHSIRIFYSPDPGKGFKPTGKRLKNGHRFTYNQVAIDENGDKWYRIGAHQWIYGPHTKVDSEQDITHYQSRGQGYVKKDAIAYHIDKNGLMVPKTHKGKLVSTRDKKHPKVTYVIRGKGKKAHRVKKVTYPTKHTHKVVKDKLPKGYKKLNYGQVTVGNTVYYKLSNGTYVKSSSIDWNKPRSSKPTLPKDIIKDNAKRNGFIEIYDAPAKGHSINITVPVGESLDVTHTAEGADGNTWYEITYKGHTGWIPASNADMSADGDLEPTAPDDSQKNPNTKDSTVTQTEVVVTLGDGAAGLVYPENGITHEVPRVLNVDLSSYIQHDDQDLSGQQDDGSFVATDDDKRQLREAAEQYVIEHRIGEPTVSLTISYAQSSDVEGDLTSLNLYDVVTVKFDPYDVEVKAEVSSTNYNPLTRNYTSITIGDIPKTWQHLLVEAANKKTNDLSQRVRENTKHTGHLFQDMHAALKLEGDKRVRAEEKIAEQVGLVDEKTKQLDIDYKTLDNQITSIDANVTEMGNEIRSGGTQELQFVDHSGYSNFLHPTEIRAVNDDGSYLRFNSEGLGWFDSKNGQLRTAITAQGELAAERISAGIIDTLNINTGEIHGALKVGDSNGGIKISIGTRQPTENPLRPNFGGNGIWLDGGQYHSLVSAGRFVTRDSSEGDTWEYGTNGPMHNGTFLKSIVKGWVDSWIHKTVTVGGKKYPIYR